MAGIILLFLLFFRSRLDFLADMKQIVDNSVIYNGDMDILTLSARKLLDRVVLMFKENEQKLMKLEQQINPLLDDNDQVALTYIFTVSYTSYLSSSLFRFNNFRSLSSKYSRIISWCVTRPIPS